MFLLSDTRFTEVCVLVWLQEYLVNERIVCNLASYSGCITQVEGRTC